MAHIVGSLKKEEKKEEKKKKEQSHSFSYVNTLVVVVAIDDI